MEELDGELVDRILGDKNLLKKFSREIDWFISLMSKVVATLDDDMDPQIKDFNTLVTVKKKGLKTEHFLKFFCISYDQIRVHLLEIPYNSQWPYEEKLVIELKGSAKKSLKAAYSIAESMNLANEKNKLLERQLHKSLLSLYLIVAENDNDDQGVQHITNNISKINDELGITTINNSDGGLFSNLGSMLNKENIEKLTGAFGGKDGFMNMAGKISELSKSDKFDPQEALKMIDPEGKLRGVISENIGEEASEKLQTFLSEVSKETKEEK